MPMVVQIVVQVLILVFLIITSLARSGRTIYSSPWISDEPERQSIVLRITNAIRHAILRRKCRKFLKQNKNNYVLSNNFVNLTYDIINQKIICRNKKNHKQKFTVYAVSRKIDDESEDYSFDTSLYLPEWYNLKTEWHNLKIAPSLSFLGNLFEESFDNICLAFDENSTYIGIKDFYEKYYEIEEAGAEAQNTNNLSAEVKTKSQESIITVNEYFRDEIRKPVNINTATDVELSKLPGVNIITAKKIIRYREIHNGFNSKEDFYKQMKINSYLKEKIDLLIKVEKSSDNTGIISNENERIIDF